MQKLHQGINFNVYTAKKTVFVCFAIFKYQLQFRPVICHQWWMCGRLPSVSCFVFPPPSFFFLSFLSKWLLVIERLVIGVECLFSKLKIGFWTHYLSLRSCLWGHCKLPASQFKEEIICPWASSRIFIWLSCLLDESCTLNCLCLSHVFTRKRYIRPVCLLSMCSWMSYYHVTLI